MELPLNDLCKALTCTISSGLTRQKIEGRRRNASTKYARGKRTFSLKSADKQLAPVSSISIILDKILPAASSVEQLLLHFTLQAFIHQLMKFLSSAWCIQSWRKSWKALQHMVRICGKNSMRIWMLTFLTSKIWHCSEYLWCMHKRENSYKILENSPRTRSPAEGRWLSSNNIHFLESC